MAQNFQKCRAPRVPVLTFCRKGGEMLQLLFLIPFVSSAAAPGPLWPPLPPAGCETDPSMYDITWHTPASDCRGQLPLGNGECSASIWVEGNGDILAYVVKSDSLDELGSRDKLARVRVRLDPPLKTSDPSTFTQKLVLGNASVVISDGSASGYRYIVTAFVDANNPALRIHAEMRSISSSTTTATAMSPTHFEMTAVLEVWRTGPTVSQGDFCTPDQQYGAVGDTIKLQNQNNSSTQPPPPFLRGLVSDWYRSGDVLLEHDQLQSLGADLYDGDAIGVCHPNPDATSESLINSTLARQGIDMEGHPIFNPMKGRTFGAWLTGSTTSSVDTSSASLSSTTVAAATSFRRLNKTSIASNANLHAAKVKEDKGQTTVAGQTLTITMLTTINRPEANNPPIGPENSTSRSAAATRWAVQASSLAKNITAISFAAAAEQHTILWQSLWNRSYVRVSLPVSQSPTGHHAPGDGGFAGDPSAMLTVQRYLDLADGRQSVYPIHGGGQAWSCGDFCSIENPTPQRCAANDKKRNFSSCTMPTNEMSPCNPDDYRWWESYWQEGRHPYYSALPAGDGADMLPALYKVYNDVLPVHQARVKSWWGLKNGGAVVPERFYIFGPIDNPTYGCSTPPASPDLATGLYQKYHWVGTVMLCSLGLDDWDYHRDPSSSISRSGTDGGESAASAAARKRFEEMVLPICLNSTTFYAEHYSNDTADGKMDMFPAQAEETWQCYDPHDRNNCTANPSSDIAALWSVTTRLLGDNATVALLAPAEVSMLKALQSRIPPLPQGPRPYLPNPTDEEVYLPAARVPPNNALDPTNPPHGGNNNDENVELHGVWPLRLTRLGLMNATLASTTYNNRPFPCGVNRHGYLLDAWCEDGNVAAMLGLADQAAAQVLAALTYPSTEGWRFPGWHSGGGDNTPTMMPQSVLRQTMHSMLLQHDQHNKILLFPALPKDWDVSFKLHGPGGMVVAAKCVNNTVVQLDVVPASRRSDVVVVGCGGKEGRKEYVKQNK